MNNAIYPNITKREDPRDYLMYVYIQDRAEVFGLWRLEGESNVSLACRLYLSVVNRGKDIYE